MKENIFFADKEDSKMIQAIKKAQETFKYFWRELSWEYRRIIPALDMAYVKVAFTQKIENSEKILVEHMWIKDIEFDGEKISGLLINQPDKLTNIVLGDSVEIPLYQISDWLFTSLHKAYGGFTIQAIRSTMDDKARNEHDSAWGLDFGDYDDILLVIEQQDKPENLVEHPMSKNMREKLLVFINENPDTLNSKDEVGNSFLHREVIAGNKTSVEVLKAAGANLTLKNNYGKTALDYAKLLNWEHIIPILEN